MTRLRDHREIAGRFNGRFGRRAGVLLLGGAPEPLYLPSSANRPALIRYTRDHAQSALHEIAHWLLAGPTRRQLVDYGFWYQPPPRSPADQARFYRAEVPVQALEMLLARAAGWPFHFSADNPGADGGGARAAFEARVGQRFDRLYGEALCGDSTGEVTLALDALNPSWRGHIAAAPVGARPNGAGAGSRPGHATPRREGQ